MTPCSLAARLSPLAGLWRPFGRPAYVLPALPALPALAGLRLARPLTLPEHRHKRNNLKVIVRVLTLCLTLTLQRDYSPNC